MGALFLVALGLLGMQPWVIASGIPAHTQSVVQI